ncbi:MAG: GNAT family N-acetyltransferase [Clostridium sp.]
MFLRDATKEDEDLLYKWRNEKACVENSISKKRVTINEHSKWFDNTLKDNNKYIFLLENNGEPVGMIRGEKSKNVITLSYSIEEKSRGKGLGKSIIMLFEEKVAIYGVENILGYVLKENAASCKIFESLKYNKEDIGDLYRYEKNI